MDLNKPEVILLVHRVDRYKVILLGNVPMTLHKALRKIQQNNFKITFFFNHQRQ